METRPPPAASTCVSLHSSRHPFTRSSAAPAPLTAQFLLLRYALQHMPVLQFNSAASAAITRRAWHGKSCTCFVLRSFVPASCSPAHSTGKQGNGHGQQPNSYAPACCVYCGSLLQLQGGAGLRGKCGECCRVKSPCGGSSGAPACQTIASLHTSSTLHPLRITLSTAPLRAAAKQ